MNEWVVYILQCKDGSFYTGITTDIERRLYEHNYSNKAAKYTRGRRPVKLVYQIGCKNRAAATKLEYKVRNLNRWEKQKLVREAHDGAGLQHHS